MKIEVTVPTEQDYEECGLLFPGELRTGLRTAGGVERSGMWIGR